MAVRNPAAPARDQAKGRQPMDPKHVSPDPGLGPAQAEDAAPDDLGNLFQRFCRLHGITPELAVALANLWLRQEQIARLQAMHADHPISRDPEYVSPASDHPGGLLWRAQAEAASLIGDEGLARLRAAGLAVTMDAEHMRQALGPGFHVTDPETGATHVDYPGLVACRDDDAGPNLD